MAGILGGAGDRVVDTSVGREIAGVGGAGVVVVSLAIAGAAPRDRSQLTLAVNAAAGAAGGAGAVAVGTAGGAGVATRLRSSGTGGAAESGAWPAVGTDQATTAGLVPFTGMPLVLTRWIGASHTATGRGEDATERTTGERFDHLAAGWSVGKRSRQIVEPSIIHGFFLFLSLSGSGR